MRNKYILILIAALCLQLSNMLYASPAEGSEKTHTVKGVVRDGKTGEPVGFATITIADQQITTISGLDGRFALLKVPVGRQTVQVSCLGYNTKETVLNVSANREITIKIDASSYALDELLVMAKKNKFDKYVVGQTAIEYVQPTSLADILLLLPGSVYKENDMTKFGQISSRQVGSDANTSLGVSVMTDGAPITNDGMRTQMIGVTNNTTALSGYGDNEIRQRTGMNQGVDMRYISTDHIESVEFTRGITSARYGNLSSGMIQVNSKYGVSPLSVRVKADLKNKLLYAGTGFKLSDRGGTLHIGADFLNSINDIREEMDKFTRFTAQANYNNQLKWSNGFQLDLNAKLSQTITVNKTKRDELTSEYNEDYKADYSRTALMLKSGLTMTRRWIDRIDFLLSTDVTFDKIKRHKMVLSSSGPLSMPIAKEEGEHEGYFLPGKYYSDFEIDNVPVNLFAQLNLTSRFQLSEWFSLNVEYGADYRRSKNHGDGAVIEDETRPPFPYENSYMRPRPNWQIPALSIGSAYVQMNIIWRTGQNSTLKLSPGGRVTRMFNLANDYALAGKLLTEPRVNATFTFGNTLRNSFRAGFGMENKLPTLDYLYPEKVYKDFYMLNAFTDNPQYRRLITYTNIYDLTNKQVRENRNRKFEVGWDLEYKDFSLSVTAFYERTNNGFEYFKSFMPITYLLYNKLKPGVDISNRIPQKEDYIEQEYSIFTNTAQVQNSRKTLKKGLEYRIILPRIRPLYTTVELNGAYYETSYGSSLPYYYYPNRKIADDVYPYVGVYNIDARDEYRRFNTNVWLNTHIPKFKLAFTNFIQIVWVSTSQYKDNRTRYPYEYLDLKGNTHAVTQADIAKMESTDMVYRFMRISRLPIDYARNSKPVSLLWNIKATKEFNRYAKLSFFVNGILDINPKYLSGSKNTERDWSDPYFGMELYLNFNI